MKNIFEVSSRTRCKIIKRLGIECSSCGWDKSVCDLHHIIPKSIGGTNDHTNLTVLCPNCHRLAHDKKITDFTSLEEHVGDRWKDYYAQSNIKSVSVARKGNAASIERRRLNAESKAMKKIEAIKTSSIDFSKYGWVAKVSEQFGIKHQHVSRLMKKYDESFYHTCYKRSGN